MHGVAALLAGDGAGRAGARTRPGHACAHPGGQRQQLPAVPVPRRRRQAARLRSRHVEAVPGPHRHPGRPDADGLGRCAAGTAVRPCRRDRHALPHALARGAVRLFRALCHAAGGHLRRSPHQRRARRGHAAGLSGGRGARRCLRGKAALDRHHRPARIHRLSRHHPGRDRRRSAHLLHGRVPGGFLSVPLLRVGAFLPRLRALHRRVPPRRAQWRRGHAAGGRARHRAGWSSRRSSSTTSAWPASRWRWCWR